jgi:putative endonuclease
MMISDTAPAHWTDPRHRLGWEAEARVARWLISHGWKVEAHRWKLGHHDLDLVMRRGPLVAFVEVKLRMGSGTGSGEEAISRRKRSRIEQVAWSWIVQRGQSGDQYRFDVAAVTGVGPRATLRYLEDAWRPGWR